MLCGTIFVMSHAKYSDVTYYVTKNNRLGVGSS